MSKLTILFLMSSTISDLKPSRILGNVYLGSRVHAKSRALLEDLNITHILNCTPTRTMDIEAGCPNFFEKDSRFTYKRIAIFDNQGEDILGHMDSAFSFIEVSQHYGNILVHCHRGISRSATFVIGYLMKKYEMALNEALEHVRSCRSTVNPNESFLEQLQSLHEHLKQERISVNDDNISSIGPCMPPSNESIGPLLQFTVHPSDEGPTVAPINNTQPKESVNEENANSIGPCMPPSNESIGPILPCAVPLPYEEPTMAPINNTEPKESDAVEHENQLRPQQKHKLDEDTSVGGQDINFKKIKVI